ncbi:MerR family transcriptional regulator [Streptomyces sp. KN37]|uniref:MerR family transcriptional regulator n=1 Tax=Streptomyces sp. KN37 TaxID=3090667 RepID=UPI002A75A035|nr:MerR family transcriptional regulator [Streptomyces sp. KN37]WPO75715.1 MerR family transcriptional regulator [Streptomyces sp. KN37]
MVRLNVGMKSSEDGGADTLSIGALAARFGLATHVLRHWEAMGLLHPGRDVGGRRRYGTDDVTRVATILILKEAGLGLNTIRSLSATADRATRYEILHPAAEELRSRIAAAQASLELIEGGLNCGYEDVAQCPSYRRLIAERVGPRSSAGEPVIDDVAPTS